MGHRASANVSKASLSLAAVGPSRLGLGSHITRLALRRLISLSSPFLSSFSFLPSFPMSLLIRP
eukprot:4745600-Pyramimonas_sp.AAC.1